MAPGVCLAGVMLSAHLAAFMPGMVASGPPWMTADLRYVFTKVCFYKVYDFAFFPRTVRDQSFHSRDMSKICACCFFTLFMLSLKVICTLSRGQEQKSICKINLNEI